jgi:PAS domain S-box-containing protein
MATPHQHGPVDLLPVSEDVPVAAAAHRHAVQFYEADEFLIDGVARYVAAGLVAGEPAVVIATEAHLTALRQRLTAGQIDVARSCATGQLTLLDAAETLASFTVDGALDRGRFRSVVGGLVQARSSSGRPVRAYGEMVDLLWQRGERRAAAELEEMWNRLGEELPLALLCAYRMGNFVTAADAADFDAICRSHSHVVPTERFVGLASDDARGREISRLQQQARALEGELAVRRELEADLRQAVEAHARTAEALRASEAELRDFLDSAAEGIHAVDGDGVIVWANQAELDLVGYPREEYVGQPIARFHADPEVIADILARLGRGETLRNYEARLRARDGSIRHVLIHSNVLWRNGEFVHTRCFTRDITERRQAEDQLRQLDAERLELYERERVARAAAESASRTKDEFLAMLGHELRNPLAPIRTAIELSRLRGNTSRELDVIERQVAHMVRLVDDLLDVARITRGKVDLHRERFEISEAIAAAIETASPLLEQRGQVLSLAVPRRGLTVTGDRARLAQVVANLITNAAKYSDPGSPVTIAADRVGDRIRIRVRDHGIGIAPEMLERIFDSFVQQPQAKDRAHGGLGLGLALVRSLVELHGGQVGARSAGLGQGSEFSVELPAGTALGAPAPGRQDDAGAAAASQARILVVDDNVDAAELVGEVLNARGFDVRVAHDGPAALRIAAEFRPTIGLLDIGLPVMDGHELAGRLLAEPWAGGLRLVAISGYGQEADKERSRQAGFVEHAVKPLDLGVLDRILARLTS